MKQLYDPRRKQGRDAALILLAVISVAIVLLLIFGRDTHGVYGTGAALLLLLCIVVLAAGILALLVFRRTAQVRQRAIHGEQKLLAAEQPVADENALLLSTTITLQLKKKRFFLVNGIFYTIPFGIFSFFINWQGKSFLAHFLAACITGLLFGLIMITFNYFMVGRRMTQIITVDEEGVTTTANGDTTHIAWQDARFFGVQRIGLSRGTHYELASNDAVVYWWWMHSIKHFLNVLQPTLPEGEYDAKMAALISYVAGKTHLPLYELNVYKETPTT